MGAVGRSFIKSDSSSGIDPVVLREPFNVLLAVLSSLIRALVSIEQIGNYAVDMDNSQHVGKDMLDPLESYYKVARKHSVDAIYQQGVDYMLFMGPERVRSRFHMPDRMLKLNHEQPDMIARDDAASEESTPGSRENWRASGKQHKCCEN